MDNNTFVSLQDAIEKSRNRSLYRRNFTVERVGDLGIEWVDKGQHSLLPNGGYIASKLKDQKGTPLALSKSAMKTACRLIGANTTFFDGFSDKNAFAKILQNKLDKGKSKKTFKIRTGLANGRYQEVLDAILPGKYKINDVNQQLSYLASIIRENLGFVNGVHISEEGFGESISYRLIIGENIVKSQDDHKGQFLSLNLKMSEIGLFNDEVTLGLYRMICKNGAWGWDTSLVAKWNHTTNMDKYLETISGTVYKSQHIAKIWSEVFNLMSKTRLDRHASDYLFEMNNNGLISVQHYDYCNDQIKIGHPQETQYDLFNILTRAAQELPTIALRQSAERKALKIFTGGRGINGALEDARKERARQ